MSHTYILTLSCQDRRGIVHGVTGFLLERAGNIEEAAQFNDTDTGLFFMRVRFSCPAAEPDELRQALAAFAEPFGMTWGLHPVAERLRGVEGIAVIDLDEKDVIRHELVTRVL